MEITKRIAKFLGEMDAGHDDYHQKQELKKLNAELKKYHESRNDVMAKEINNKIAKLKSEME